MARTPDPRTRTVIVGGARTPFGRFLGGLSSLSAAQLGAAAISAALERYNVPAGAVDHVVMGQVLTAGARQMPARQAASLAGLDMSVPATNVNKVCLSGIAAIADADRLIRSGDAQVVIAGGMESMSQAPHLLPASRTGNRYGDFTAVDSMNHDGLWDYFTNQSMGALTEQANAAGDGFSREEQDEFAVRSHQRAALAQENGTFDGEIVPVHVPQRRGGTAAVTADESIRTEVDAESLASLRPAFGAGGSITAATASPISDGAAVVILMSQARAEELGLPWLAEIGTYASVAGPDSTLQYQPARAIEAAASREGLTAADLDIIEINEAFAAVGLASAAALGVPAAKLNANGGALALGHPIGASGARLVLHTALELSRRGTGTGVAALCGGGGQGDAMILHAPGRTS
ncbi:acetyl-CoA C-acetyltransferase [Arthrobacter sp. UYP6]|uniref:acetyl-CoA C-acetyltransferase n=1 Tax=Arthrobacter sp. UYP6 TaxID=1756378 RepID=UPI0033908E2D